MLISARKSISTSNIPSTFQAMRGNLNKMDMFGDYDYIDTSDAKFPKRIEYHKPLRNRPPQPGRGNRPQPLPSRRNDEGFQPHHLQQGGFRFPPHQNQQFRQRPFRRNPGQFRNPGAGVTRFPVGGGRNPGAIRNPYQRQGQNGQFAHLRAPGNGGGFNRNR